MASPRPADLSSDRHLKSDTRERCGTTVIAKALKQQSSHDLFWFLFNMKIFVDDLRTNYHNCDYIVIDSLSCSRWSMLVSLLEMAASY
jgi:hypothetical protein